MENRYREMFDEVRASDRLRTEVLRMRERENGRRGRLPAAALAAAVLAVILAGTALAVTSPTLRSWFSREWAARTGGSISENQALLIDSLTQEVGESAVSGGLTVTLDSVTVGGDVLWALVDVEGMDFAADERYSFDRIGVEILPDPNRGEHGGAAHAMGSIGLTERGAARMLLEYSGVFSSGSQLNGGGYTLELDLGDLILCRAGDREDQVLREGSWRFSVPLTVESLSPEVVIDSAQVTAGRGPDQERREYAVWDIRLTATGLTFRTGGESVDGGLELEETAAILADGTEVVSTEGGGSRTEDGNWFSTCQWPVPIDVESVAAIRIGGTEIPLP